MKKLFFSPGAISIDLGLLLLRLGFGFLMMFGHGYGKLIKLASGEAQFPALFGLSPVINLGLATFAEFFCSLFLILGIFTRLSTLPLIATMITAAFIVHAGDPLFNPGGANKEFALLYLIPYLTLFFMGPGKYSFDYIIRNR